MNLKSISYVQGLVKKIGEFMYLHIHTKVLKSYHSNPGLASLGFE